MKTVYFKDVWWIKSFLYFISEILDFISSGCIVFLSTASTYGCLKKFARCTNTFSRYTERSILVACDPYIVCTKVRLHLLPNLQKIQTNKKKNQIQWVNYKTIKPDLQATNTFLFGFNCLSGSPGKPSNVTLSPGTLPSGAFSSSNDDLSSGLAHITMACDVIPRILKSQTTSQNNRFTFQCRFDFVRHLIKSLVPLIY